MPAPRARTRGADGPDRAGQDGAHVDGHGAGPDARRRRPSGPVEQRADRRVVGEHRDDDVGRGRRLGRGRGDGRPDPRGERRRPVARSGCRRRPRSPGRPAARPSPSPSGRSRGRRPPVRSSPRVAHAASSRRRRIVSTMRSTDGIARSSSAAADGSGMCGVVIRTIGRVEAVEALVGDDRGDLGAPAAQPRVLLDGEQAAGLADRGEDRRGVERDERAEVDDLGVDAVARRPAARPPRAPSAPSRPARRSSRPCRRGRSARSRACRRCSPSGTSPLIANSALCSQKMTGSGSRIGGRHQADHVGRRRRRDDLEAGDRHRPVLDALGVLRAEPEAAAVRGPEHERQRRPGRRSCSGSWRSGWRPCPRRPRRSRENMSSAIGRRPVIAAPIAAPTIACSLIGVSRTRSGPNRVEQALGQLEHAAGRADVLADAARRSGRAPSPGRSPRGDGRRDTSVPPRRASVGPDLGLERRPATARERSRASASARGDRRRASRPRSRRASPRPTPAASSRVAVGRDRVARLPRGDLVVRAGTCRGRRASGRRGGRSAPRSSDGPSPARARSIAAARDRVHRVDVVAVDDDRLEAVGRRRGRRPGARPRSRRRSACTPCTGCSRRRTRPAPSRPRRC